MSLDTSAGRLFQLLEPLRKKSSSYPASQAWAEVLGTSTDRELFHRLPEVMDLCDRVVREATSLEDPDERALFGPYLNGIKQVAASLVNVGYLKVQHFQGFLPDEMMLSLQHCELAFKRSGLRSPTIDQEAAADLLADVQSLMKAIADDPDLATQDKVYLLRHLHEVERALLGIRIGGFDSLEQAATVLVGSAIVVNEAIRQTHWEKLMSLAQRALGLARGAQAIGGAVESSVKAIESIRTLVD